MCIYIHIHTYYISSKLGIVENFLNLKAFSMRSGTRQRMALINTSIQQCIRDPSQCSKARKINTRYKQ